MAMLYLDSGSLRFFFYFIKENRKDLKVKAEDCIGQRQLSHPGPPIGRLINKVLSHKRERCRMMEHNRFAMVIDLITLRVGVCLRLSTLVDFFNLIPCSSVLLLSNLNISLLGMLILQKMTILGKKETGRERGRDSV